MAAKRKQSQLPTINPSDSQTAELRDSNSKLIMMKAGFADISNQRRRLEADMAQLRAAEEKLHQDCNALVQVIVGQVKSAVTEAGHDPNQGRWNLDFGTMQISQVQISD